MISEAEYTLLKKIKTDKNGIDNNSPLFTAFVHERFIVPITNQYNTFGYKLTVLGERAIEEYENNMQSIQRDTESVTVARESNEIAKNANCLSEESNKISKKANRLSVLAIVFSAIAALAATFSAVVSVKSCSREAAQHFVNFDNHHLLVIFVADSNPVFALSKINVPIKIF